MAAEWPDDNALARSRPPVGLLVAIFAITLSVLALEIALTRAFSVLLRYHFVFLTISLAMCGLGLGGLVEFIIRHRWPQTRPSLHVLVVAAGGVAVCAPLSMVLLFSTPLAAHLTSVGVITAVCLPVFVFAGIFLSHAFAHYAAWSGQLYFADLSGAAAGSLLVIVFLQLTGGINTAIICGVLAAGAAVVVAYLSRQQIALLAAGVLTSLLIAGLAGNLAFRWIDLPRLPPAAGPNTKPLYRELGNPSIKAQIVYSEWNAFARTDVVAYARPDGRYYQEDDLFIYTDGEVPTNLIHFQGDLTTIRDQYADFIGFLPFRIYRPSRVLSIGPGGGLDVLMALAAGADQIEGVELNPAMLHIVRRYRDQVGPIYDYANVDVRVGEGRSFVSRCQQQYDMIYMALTKTATTTGSSLALMESYAHTTEAFVQYYRHLSPQGQLAFVCQHPAILFRALLTAREAVMQTQGISGREAMGHLTVVSTALPPFRSGPYRHLLIMSRQPFSPSEAQRLGEVVVALGLIPGFIPGAYEPVPFRWLSDEEMTSGQFVRRFNRWQHYPPGEGVNFTPCTDDRPFVVDISFGIPVQFKRLIGIILALMVVLSGGAWWWLSRQAEGLISGSRFLLAVLYFSLLGAGFMLLEVVLAQKLILYLGYPVLTLSVILFAVLIGGGIGSLTSQRWRAVVVNRRAAVAAAAVAVLALALYLLLPALISSTLYLDIRLRSLITMAVLLPIGFCLGIPFPSGLRLVSGAKTNIIPWMWGINGLASVIGSVAAMILAKLFGFSIVMLVGIAIYAAAACLLAMRAVGYPSSEGL